MQKSTQPIGARVGSPTVMKIGRSDGADDPPKDAVCSPADATLAEVATTATPARASTLAAHSACLKRLAIAAPRLVGATFPTNRLYWG
jgi:hypothetical protein